jgi:hypothetical protein
MTTQRNHLMITLSLVAMLALTASPAMAKKGADHAKDHKSMTHVAAAGNSSKGSGGGLGGLSAALGVFNGLVGGMGR